MKQLIIILILVLQMPISALSQKKLILGQYMHNRYAINPAFAGSREVLSMFASYRKQWTSVPNSPQSQYFSAHSPLKNEKVAIGMVLFNEEFAISKNSGISLSYTYRLNVGNNNKLALSINGGFISAQTMWGKVDLIDINDPAFGENETDIDPQAGFGIAWYDDNFFTGFSISDLLYNNSLDPDSPFFSPSKSDYIVTSGYLYKVNENIKLQPSMLLRYNPDEYTLLDISATAIYRDMIWLGLTYRNNKEISTMAGWQVTPQLRFAYSYDYPSGDLSTLNNGNHEISLQFDFGYKIPTSCPRFF